MQKPLSICNGKKIFYGWFVVAGSFIILFFNAICYAILGITMEPISVEMGWSARDMAKVVFVYMVIHAFSVPLGGKIYDLFGPKITIISFSVFLLAGNLVAAFTHNLLAFTLAFGLLIGIGMGGPATPLMGAIICKWFNKYRGLAISLAVCGFCAGLFVLAPLTSYFVEKVGWREAFMLVGVVLFIVNTVVALTIIKGDPKNFGLIPLGSGEIGKKPIKAFDPEHDLSLTKAFKTNGFWYMLIVMTVCGVGCGYLSMYFISVAVFYDISLLTASTIFGLTGIYSIIGMLVAGPLADKLGGRWPLTIAMFLRVLGFAVVLYAQTIFTMNILALLMGLTFMATLPISNTVAASMFGTSHIGFITGILTTGHHLGGALVAVFVALLFRPGGDYTMVFVVIVISGIIGTIAALLIKKRRYYFEQGKIVYES